MDGRLQVLPEYLSWTEKTNYQENILELYHVFFLLPQYTNFIF